MIFLIIVVVWFVESALNQKFLPINPWNWHQCCCKITLTKAGKSCSVCGKTVANAGSFADAILPMAAVLLTIIDDLNLGIFRPPLPPLRPEDKFVIAEVCIAMLFVRLWQRACAKYTKQTQYYPIRLEMYKNAKMLCLKMPLSYYISFEPSVFTIFERLIIYICIALLACFKSHYGLALSMLLLSDAQFMFVSGFLMKRSPTSKFDQFFTAKPTMLEKFHLETDPEKRAELRRCLEDKKTN